MTRQNPSEDLHAPPRVREPSLMLSDITADLIWPRIMRAPAMALSPSRLITGAICAFLLSLVLSFASLFKPAQGQPPEGFYADLLTVFDRFTHSAQDLTQSALSLDLMSLTHQIGAAAKLLGDTVMEFPLISLALGLPLIAILAVVGGAIARSTAIEFAYGRYASSDDTMGFALRRTRQFVGAAIGPVLVCVAIFLLIAIGGLLLSVPVLDVLGSILYAIGLGLGIFATIVLMLHVLALPMIVPALAVEATDSFDAIQRAYAYVISRPLRYIIYALLLLILGILSVGVFTMVASVSIEMTNWAASFFGSDSINAALTGDGDLGATKGTAHAIINIWRTIVDLFVAGYAISIFFTSSTLLYLVIRRVCDGQDINEVWIGEGE